MSIQTRDTLALLLIALFAVIIVLRPDVNLGAIFSMILASVRN